MKLEIWSDIVCPWCGIGQGNLRKALAGFEHASDVDVVYRSFQLMPHFPVGESQQTSEFLREVKRMTDQQVRTNDDALLELAREAGFSEFRVSKNQIGNTGLAHQFLAYASYKGKHTVAWHHLYAEYYERGKPLWTAPDLAALAPGLGLDSTETQAALDAGTFQKAVEEDRLQAAYHKIPSIPFFLIDGHTIVTGRSSGEILNQLQDAWKALESGQSLENRRLI